MSDLPERVELDTPAGRLVVTWPQGQPIYAEGLEPVGVIPPPDPEPSATLDGKPVTMAEARAILARMEGQ